MINILVSDVMTRTPFSVPPETTLLECSKLMVKRKVGSLLIVQDKILLGIISQHDILWALVKKSIKDLSKIKAIDISPRKIATIRPTAHMEEALDKMKRLRFERLPVIHKKELVGLITIRDILNFHPEYYKELEEFAQIREETNKVERIQKARKTAEEGICEECGNLDYLYRYNGMMVCSDCRVDN